VSVERDVLERLAALELPHYVTGSWALAVYAEPRMTRDIDVVVDMTTSDYAARVRRAFERDFVVNEPLDLGGRWLGGLIHQVEIVRVGLVFGRSDAFARSAMARCRLQPALDWAYLEHYAGVLGIRERLEGIRDG